MYCSQTVGWMKMPLCMEVGLGPGHIVLDGDPALLTERGTVRLYGFRHISTFDLGVGTNRRRFSPFLQSLDKI